MKKYLLHNGSNHYRYGDKSEWEVKVTEKTVTFVCIKKGDSQDDDAPMQIRCRKDNNCQHCLKDRQDGDYTLYLYRDGQPMHFFPKN